MRRRWQIKLLGPLAVMSLVLGCGAAGESEPMVSQQTATAPAPLPAKAEIALADLEPKLAKPVDEPGADKLPERAVEIVKQAEALLAEGRHFKATELLVRAEGFAPDSPRIQRDLGLAFAGLGERTKAEMNLRNSAAKAPDHVGVQLLLGQYAALRGKASEAVVRYRTALLCSDAEEDNPDTAEALLRLAAALDRQGYWSAALEAYRRLARLISEHGLALAQRELLQVVVTQPQRHMVAQGRLLMRLRRPAEAATILERAYRRDKSHPHAGALAVQALLEAKDYGRAEGIVMEMLEEPSQRERAVAAAVQLCREQDDPARPGELLRSYVRRGGKDVGFLIAMAETAADMGRVEEARAMLKKHAPGQPEDGGLMLRLARFYAHTGQPHAFATQLARLLTTDAPESYQVAEEVRRSAARGVEEGLVESVAASADNASGTLKPALLTVAGMLAEATGDSSTARRLLRQAIEADAAFWPAYEALEGILALAGDLDQVEELIRQLRKASPAGHAGLYLIGKSQLARGQLRDAVGNLEQARGRKSDHVPTLLLLGRGYARLGRFTDAERRLVAALRLAPNNAEVVAELFDLYVERNRLKEALTLVEGLLQRDPKSVPGRVLLGRYYFLTNQIPQARRQVERLMAEAGKDVEAQLLDVRLNLPKDLRARPIPRQQAEAGLRKLKEILRRHPSNDSAGRLYADLLVNQERYLEAAEVLEALYRRSPHDVGLAEAYLAALVDGQAEERAAQAAERMAARESVGAAMRLVAVDKLMEIKRYDRAERLIGKWLAQPADRQELRVFRSKALDLYQAADDYDKAHELIDQWIATGPEAAVLSALRGRKLHLYGLEKRYDDAVAYAEKWIRNEPDSDQPRNLLIAVLVEAEAYEKAHAVVDRWIRQAKQKDLIRQMRSAKLLIYGRQKEFGKLLAFGQEWIARDPQYHQANLVTIALLLEHEQYDSALKVAEAWLTREQKTPATAPAQSKSLTEARSSVVEVLLMANRKREALDRARSFAQAAPEDLHVLHLLYSALSALERSDEAIRLLEKMHELDPDDPGVNNDLGYHQADRGVNLEKAEYMIRRALAEKPREVAFQDSLAWVLYKQGRFAEAKTIFDRVVRADPERLHPVILDHAGDTCWRLGLKTEAMRLWERAVSMAKEKQAKDPESRKVLSRAPKKVAAGQRGKQPRLAPLARGLR